jgi:hypothetical protein
VAIGEMYQNFRMASLHITIMYAKPLRREAEKFWSSELRMAGSHFAHFWEKKYQMSHILV